MREIVSEILFLLNRIYFVRTQEYNFGFVLNQGFDDSLLYPHSKPICHLINLTSLQHFILGFSYF